MFPEKKLFSNTSFMLASNIMNSVLTLVLLVLVARFLGPEGLGLYSFAMALAAIFVIFTEFGMDSFTAREVALNPGLANKYAFHNVAARAAISAALIIFIMALFMLLGFGVEKIIVISGLFLYLALRSVASSFKSVFTGLERMHYTAFLSTLSAVIALLSAAILLYYGFALYGLVAGFIIAGAVELLAASLVMRKKIPNANTGFDMDFIKMLVAKSVPFGALGAVISIYFSIDILVITIFSGNSNAGLYSAAYKIAIATTLLSEPFAVALFPSISRAFKSSSAKFKGIFVSSLGSMLVVALPISILFFVFPEKIVLVLYGQDYGQSVAVFRLLSFMPLLLFLNLLITTVLKATERQNAALLNAIIAVAIGIALDIVFLYNFGIEGVAVAAMLTQSIFLMLGIVSLPKELFFTSLPAGN
jgi:O-antigen/teichoic acid export membrane protein